MFWAIVITALFMVLEIIVYAGLISAMPRAGGDYVWMSRIFHSAVGFIIAAVGWWFILWLWTPIYADMGVQTTVKPIFRILGWHSAADWLSSRTGIFVSALVVIAIASILVAIGMKAYAKFQVWAMWIGLAGRHRLRCAAARHLRRQLQGEVQRRCREVLRRRRGACSTSPSTSRTRPASSSTTTRATWSSPRARPTPARSRPSRPSARAPACRNPRSTAASASTPGTSSRSCCSGWRGQTGGRPSTARCAEPRTSARTSTRCSAASSCPTLIALAFLGLMTWKVGYQAFMGTMASFWWGISPIGGDYISPTAMISWIVPNAAFQVILIASISLLALRLVRHAVPVVDPHDLRVGLRPHPA